MSAKADGKFASEGERRARFIKQSKPGHSLKDAARCPSTLHIWQWHSGLLRMARLLKLRPANSASTNAEALHAVKPQPEFRGGLGSTGACSRKSSLTFWVCGGGLYRPSVPPKLRDQESCASTLRPEEGEKSMLDIKIGFVIEGKEVPVDSLVEALVREIPSSAREKIRARISKLRVA